MEALISALRQLLPAIRFESGKAFYWSPETSLITYRDTKNASDEDRWALLHEAGHAALKHQSYSSDFELLLLEVAAWGKATELGNTLGVSIDKDHVEDCLDTYRDWLHRRSTCPTCSCGSLQVNASLYQCYNCTTQWGVSTSRFCRAYRRKQLTSQQKKLPASKSQATFI